MKKYNLVSKYELRGKKRAKSGVNNDNIPNEINRKFGGRDYLDVVVSDLTYVKVNDMWNYICLITELGHREIIGYAAAPNKDAYLVEKAMRSIKYDLRKINLFHTDRGAEFKNSLIDRQLDTFGIKRSLSRKGSPIDNAVAESMYNILKTEFVFGEQFENTKDLEHKLNGWVRWYNNERIHGSLGYLTPAESKNIRAIGTKPTKNYRKYTEKDIATR